MRGRGREALRGLFPFWVLLLCALIQGGILGIVSNCRGLFYDPVCRELGIQLGEFTTYSTFYGLAVCAGIPLATRAVSRWNLRVTLGVSGAVMAAAQYAMGWFTAPWQWYVAAALQGLCHALLFVQTVPMLVSNWFAVRKGFFLGLACASSGLVGAVMNSVTSRYISLYGWRAAYRLLGGVLFLMLVPASLLFAVRAPEDVGAQPYGAGRAEFPKARQGSASPSRGRGVYPLLVAYACLICLTVGYNQILFSLGQTFDHPPQILSSFVSWAMIGTVVWKLAVGWCNDRWGIAGACYLSGGVIAGGLAALILGRSVPLMYLGSFCMGMPMAVSVVVIPNLVRGIFGNGEFEQRYKLVSMLVNLSTNFSFTLIGWLVSWFGSYTAALETGLGVTLAALVLATLFLNAQERSPSP
ncbi:MAG: MFS transporter [Oscillospiraceae bacterium]|nr:MFS transporter [Oscillospiraceae bacterium]